MLSRYSFARLVISSVAMSILIACGGNGGRMGSTTPSPQPPSPSNSAPVLSSATYISVVENSSAAFYAAAATDADGDTLTFSLPESPDVAFFTIDSNTGQISPAASLDFEAFADKDGDNIYNVTVTVTDANGGADSLDLEIELLDFPDNTSFGLQADLPPSGNFDLLDWKLDLPIDANGNLSGDNLTIGENDLSNAYESEWFFTGPDGGMVFRAPPGGATTSSNTRYARTELREMLRRGNRAIRTRGVDDRPNLNNWALSSQPQSAQNDAGGVDGVLTVSLAVNDVTETGEDFQIGRLIIGQIHAKDDEPIRLYYRKLPQNRRGAIYAAHEISGGEDIWFEIIGSRDNDADDPMDGFLLGEIFEYIIDAHGNFLDVTINRADGTEAGFVRIDMTDSGYDIENDFQYFKAGNYHLNDSANADDHSQMTIYALENTHEDMIHNLSNLHK